MNSTDVRKVKKLASRLGVRDSDVIRFAVKSMLARLGPLRAMSFRAATALDSDVYMAQFANGAAEWRIRLLKDGRIGGLALGPQY